jgi:hypothetical protein
MPDVAAALLAPLAGHPDGSGMRRTAVGSVYPDVAVTIPAVISGHPDITGMRRRGNDFDRTRRRRADTDYDLGVGGADREKSCVCCKEKSAL